MPRFFNPPTVWKPFSAFSMGVVQGDGRIVHLKGQVPLGLKGDVVGPGDMHAQVRKTLENIRDTLAHVGGEMREVSEGFFAPPYPVTTTVQVSAFFHRDILVEITGIAEVPRERFKEPA